MIKIIVNFPCREDDGTHLNYWVWPLYPSAIWAIPRQSFHSDAARHHNWWPVDSIVGSILASVCCQRSPVSSPRLAATETMKCSTRSPDTENWIWKNVALVLLSSIHFGIGRTHKQQTFISTLSYFSGEHIQIFFLPNFAVKHPSHPLHINFVDVRGNKLSIVRIT